MLIASDGREKSYNILVIVCFYIAVLFAAHFVQQILHSFFLFFYFYRCFVNQITGNYNSAISIKAEPARDKSTEFCSLGSVK